MKALSAKFKVEKFTGKNNFGLWQVKIRDLLMQQGLHKALSGKAQKPASMTSKD